MFNPSATVQIQIMEDGERRQWEIRDPNSVVNPRAMVTETEEESLRLKLYRVIRYAEDSHEIVDQYIEMSLKRALGMCVAELWALKGGGVDES